MSSNKTLKCKCKRECFAFMALPCTAPEVRRLRAVYLVALLSLCPIEPSWPRDNLKTSRRGSIKVSVHAHPSAMD